MTFLALLLAYYTGGRVAPLRWFGRTRARLRLGPFRVRVVSAAFVSWADAPGGAMNVRLELDRPVPCVSGTLAVALDGGWVALEAMPPDVTPFVPEGAPTTLLDVQFDPARTGYDDTTLIGRAARFHPGRATTPRDRP